MLISVFQTSGVTQPRSRDSFPITSAEIRISVKHEDDLDEQIDERRERDIAIPGKSVPPDHRR